MDDSLSETTQSIIARFEVTNAVRDRALNEGRQVIRLAANAVRAVHRGDGEQADRLVDDARRLLEALVESVRPHGAVYWAGYVQDAMKEFAEANLTIAVVGNWPLPTPRALGVEDAPYLNALAEAASELRRQVLDALRGDDLVAAERLVAAMDEIYGVLVIVDFPDGITGGLRRTTDQLRAVLERTRGDLTLTLNQRRLERELRRVEAGRSAAP